MNNRKIYLLLVHINLEKLIINKYSLLQKGLFSI
jgi:hypothetical protein